MIENGLRNVMEVIKRQKWEKLFKRRELVHVDAVKEFYAKLTMSHNRKKDVARSKVSGVEIEFDHMKLASILGILGNNGICEYIKEVWEESRYTKPLEITRKFANDETIIEARRVKSMDMKPFQRFIHFFEMGESGSDDQVFYAQVDVEEPATEAPAAPAFPASQGDSTNQQKEQTPSGVDLSGPSGHIPESVMIKLQAEFERASANRIQADLEKAQA
ncbi:hypothetical protein Dimus_001087 [Dionaea muscipula]